MNTSVILAIIAMAGLLTLLYRLIEDARKESMLFDTEGNRRFCTKCRSEQRYDEIVGEWETLYNADSSCQCHQYAYV